MKIKIEDVNFRRIESDILALGIFEDYESKGSNESDLVLKGIIKNLKKKGEFKGFFGQTRILASEKINAKNVLLIGLGKKNDFDIEKLRKGCALAAKLAKGYLAEKLTLLLNKEEIKNTSEVEKIFASTESVILALYDFNKYKTVDREKTRGVDEIILAAKNNSENLKAMKEAEIGANAVCYVRDFVNMPSEDMTPANLADEAKRLGKKNKFKVTVFGKGEIKRLGMNGILSVSKGSSLEPRFVVLEYKKGFGAPLCLVGKGITFDSGGLDLKPFEGMLDMKMDKAGACTVLGIFKAVSELKLKVNLIGLCPICENMPSGTAFRPGDIVRYMNKKTAEIITTDAEGRVVLADALAYSARFKPSAIIDFATLTGACIIALGYEASGLVGNNKELTQKLAKAGNYTYERVWELPFYDEYKELIKGDVADIRNLGRGKGGEAGVITGAAYLANFIPEKTAWAHLDIAGTAWRNNERPASYQRKGATGYGVRLILKLLREWR